MNESKGKRILYGFIVLLALCNIGLILTIWLKPRHDGPPRGETPRDYVIRSLKFTDEQVKKYDVLIKDHQQAMRRLRHESGEYHEALFDNLKNGAGDRFADSLAGLIAANQKQIELVTYNHFALVRALCTDEQKKKFDKIIVDVTRKMIGGPPPHPPGDGNGPPPPPDEQGPPLPGDAPPPPGKAGPTSSAKWPAKSLISSHEKLYPAIFPVNCGTAAYL